MNAADVLRLVRAAIQVSVEGLSLRILGLGFVTGLVTLIGYCLGHGLFTAEPLDLAASLRWSLAHAAGIGLLILVSYRIRKRQWYLQAGLSFVVAVAGSAIVGFLLSISAQPAYASLINYLLLSLVSSLVLAPAIEQAWVEMDFGRMRKIIPVRKILAVHGARNYLEIEVDGANVPGLVRLTMEDVLRRFPQLLIRTHRSHLVNPSAVRELHVRPRGGMILYLSNGSRVPVSARYAGTVQALLASVPAGEFSSRATSSHP